MIIIVGGQTGVDRGAHKGAWDAGLQVEGFMPKGCRDEDGAIPPGIAKDLVECSLDGYPARTTMNVELAHGLLVITENERLATTPGTRQTISVAQRYGVHVWALDQYSSLGEIEVVARSARSRLVERLMIAGPRRSKWYNGEPVARRIVQILAPFW